MRATLRSTSAKAPATSRRQVAVRASAQPNKLVGVAAGALIALSAFAPMAHADLTADLLSRSEANKAVNDKKRLATSSANLARTRTVTDGTCAFPNNLFGCDETSSALTGGVKFIAEDAALECEGTEAGKCASQVSMRR